MFEKITVRSFGRALLAAMILKKISFALFEHLASDENVENSLFALVAGPCGRQKFGQITVCPFCRPLRVAKTLKNHCLPFLYGPAGVQNNFI